MLRADVYQHGVLAVRADAADVLQGGAGDDEAEPVAAAALQLFAPQRQAVAVHGDDGKLAAAYLEHAAHVDGAALVGGDGEYRLVYHRFERLLREGDGLRLVHLRQLGVLGGVDGDEVIGAAAALHLDGVLAVHLHGDDAVRQAAEHLREQPGVEHGGAGALYLRLDGGVDALLEVVARQAHAGAGLDEQALQRGDRAFGRGRARGGGGGGLYEVLVAGKFHVRAS